MIEVNEIYLMLNPNEIPLGLTEQHLVDVLDSVRRRLALKYTDSEIFIGIDTRMLDLPIAYCYVAEASVDSCYLDEMEYVTVQLDFAIHFWYCYCRKIKEVFPR